MNRRALLSSLSAKFTLSNMGVTGGSDNSSENINQTFRVFWQVEFSGTPDVTSCAIETDALEIIYAGEMWPDMGSRVDINIRHLREHVAPRIIFRSPGRLVLDVEHWRGQDIYKYFDLLQTIREITALQWRGRLGIFEVLPWAGYILLASEIPDRKEIWLEATKRAERIIPVVDDLYPSLYYGGGRLSEWKMMAGIILSTAESYGKPVYPFLWPIYFSKKSEKRNHFIEGIEWREMLEYVYQRASGMVIWAGGHASDGSMMLWDENARWWVETKLFIANIYGRDHDC